MREDQGSERPRYGAAVKLRIDELAAATGVSSRNIRAYQARGLLPPPELEGRTGYYRDEHVTRLRLIDDLQRRGFSLAGIKETLDAWSRGGDLAQLLGFENIVLAPFVDEPPDVVPAADLFARFPEARDHPELVTRAIDLGLLAPAGDDAFAVPDPQLLDAGEVLLEQGVPLTELLDLVAAVAADIDDIARRFVALVGDRVVVPALQGDDDRAVDEAVRAIRTLRPIALEVVRPFLASALERASREALRSYREQTSADDPVTVRG